MTRRLLAVHAHPDDESSKGAGTYARYLELGAKVMVVSCTGGERGDIQNPALEARAMADRDMGGLRRIEMDAARRPSSDSSTAGSDTSTPDCPARARRCRRTRFARIPLEISAAPLVASSGSSGRRWCTPTTRTADTRIPTTSAPTR